MIRGHVSAVGLFALIGICATHATAHPLTLAECAEGGEFIRNAALARDAGASRAFLLGKLEEDLMLIQAFPPQLRWFVQDAVDEEFLSRRLEKVFDEPMKPEQHEAAFISDCIQTTASADDSDV
ncbi:MAG TPA: hypothetical protein VJT81_07250 [Burkholderiales bacterium]|nr:hypothetical protein [Burkholderiales bacterium]